MLTILTCNPTTSPATEALTEDCFNRHVLEFAHPERHTLVFKDPSKNFDVNATLVTEGGGKGWMLHPFPTMADGDCDYIVQGAGKTGIHCYYANGTRDDGHGHAAHIAYSGHCPGCGPPLYMSDGACPWPATITVASFPGISMKGAGSDPSRVPNPAPLHPMESYAVEDALKVPADIAPGDYVLSYRWDCEATSQIWQSCSDVTIE